MCGLADVIHVSIDLLCLSVASLQFFDFTAPRNIDRLA